MGDGREVDLESDDGVLQQVGNLLALTDNSDLNILLCQRWSAHLGKDKVFFWSSIQEDRGKFTGTAIWPALPKPSALSGELERGEALLAPTQEDGQAGHIPATALLSLHRDQIELNPEPKPDTPKTSLFLTRKTDYLTLSLKSELIVELEEDSLESLFATLVRHLAGQARSLPQKQTVGDLLQREKAFPTVLGPGIASPHAYSEAIETPLCALARLPHGVDFGSPEGEAVHLVFFAFEPPPYAPNPPRNPCGDLPDDQPARYPRPTPQRPRNPRPNPDPAPRRVAPGLKSFGKTVMFTAARFT